MQPLNYSRYLGHRVTKNLSFPAYLTSCSSLSSDHLPVLIDYSYRSSFHNPPDLSDFKRTDWAKFQTQLEELIPFDFELHNDMAIDTCVENGALSQGTRQRQHPSVPRVTTHGLRYRSEFRTRYASKIDWG